MTTTTKLSHTPGPWIIHHGTTGSSRSTIYSNARKTALDLRTTRICEMPDTAFTYTADEMPEVIANARLIAAAPDLLSAGNAVIKAWESGDLAAAVRLLSSAIDKAINP